MSKSTKTFKAVEILSGPLAGIKFDVRSYIVKGDHTIVVYKGPNDGPSSQVVHYLNTDSAKAEDVRIAFSKLIPMNVRWEKKKGWYNKETNQKLKWDSSRARFI